MLRTYTIGFCCATDDDRHARFKAKPFARPKADAKGCRLYPVHPVPLSSFTLGCCYAAAADSNASTASATSPAIAITATSAHG